MKAASKIKSHLREDKNYLKSNISYAEICIKVCAVKNAQGKAKAKGPFPSVSVLICRYTCLYILIQRKHGNN